MKQSTQRKEIILDKGEVIEIKLDGGVWVSVHNTFGGGNFVDIYGLNGESLKKESKVYKGHGGGRLTKLTGKTDNKNNLFQITAL